MNCECILSYVLQSINEMLQNLRNLNQQSVCDDNGCYDDINSMMGLQPRAQPTNTNFPSFAFGIVGFLVVFVILQLLVNNQRRRVVSGLEKVNLRDNPDRNAGGLI